jgi:small subunit ribosomal protein S4
VQGGRRSRGSREVAEAGAYHRALAIASQVGLPEWVEVDEKKFSGTLQALPDRDQILPDINENLVVELYSK